MQQAYYNVFKVSTGLEQPSQFKKLKIDKLTESGTYRVRKTGFDEIGRPIYKTIRYKGINALKLQLKSLRNQSDIEYQKQQFIKNYKNAMEKLHYTNQDIKIVINRIKDINAWLLSVMIKEGEFPIPDFIYTGEYKTVEDILKQIDLFEPKMSKTKEKNINKEYLTLLEKYKKTIKGY